MTLVEDVEKLEKKAADVINEQRSLAYSVLEEYSEANRRLFIVIVMLLVVLVCSFGCNIYLLVT